VTTTLFISDLHLCASRPRINQLFFDFLATTARSANQLYILGDFFEYWAGDDDLDDPFNRTIANAVGDLSSRGVEVFLMHGNRDFLIGDDFCKATGATPLFDPTLIDLNGTPSLLMHGDTLCTDDIEYQQFRTQVRNPKWQQQFLSQPLAKRKAIADDLRRRSENEKQTKPMEIMDVALATVEAHLREHRYPQLIHGHTHRPALHHHNVDGHVCKRWVLSDWYESGSYLHCDAKVTKAIQIP
jgi:UDP-2,3-diacylglucosamine hydrolase